MEAMRIRAALLVVAVTAAPLAVAAGGCRREGGGEGSGAGAVPTSTKRSITVGLTQEPDTPWMPMKQMNASEHLGRPGALALTVVDEHIDLQSMARDAHEGSWPANVPP